jgi:hypothetical protein
MQMKRNGSLGDADGAYINVIALAVGESDFRSQIKTALKDLNLTLVRVLTFFYLWPPQCSVLFAPDTKLAPPFKSERRVFVSCGNKRKWSTRSLCNLKIRMDGEKYRFGCQNDLHH